MQAAKQRKRRKRELQGAMTSFAEGETRRRVFDQSRGRGVLNHVTDKLNNYF